MIAKDVMLVSQRESTMTSMYKYRQHDKRSGKVKTSAERQLNRRGNGRKKNCMLEIQAELVEGQMTTQMIWGD